MANEWSARGERCGIRYKAVVRRVDKAEAYCLMAPDKRPLLFSTEMEAELAGSRHLIWLWNNELRFAITPSSISAVSLEESTFGTVSSKKGKATVKRRLRRKRAAAREHA